MNKQLQEQLVQINKLSKQPLNEENGNQLRSMVGNFFHNMYSQFFGNGQQQPAQQPAQSNGVNSFQASQLYASPTASSRGIDNTPPPEAMDNLQALADNILNKLPVKVSVSSGYRSPALNQAIGGATASQHMKGQAADFSTGSKEGNKKLFDWILNQSGLPFDQLIDEKGYQWIHISYSRNQQRKQVLHL